MFSDSGASAAPRVDGRDKPGHDVAAAAGNGPRADAFKSHADHRFTTLPDCRRRRLRRRLGLRPDDQPRAKEYDPRHQSAGPEPEQGAEAVERRHPSERGGSRHPKAGAQDRRSECRPAARDFRRRSRAAAEIKAFSVMAGLDPAIHGRRASIVQVDIEVPPIRIHVEDQPNFPGARPVLHVGLTLDRSDDILVEFVPYEQR